MNRGFSLLWSRRLRFGYACFRYSVLRFNFVTPFFAIHSAGCRFRFGHWTGYGGVAVGFEFAVYIGDQLLIVLRSKPFLAEQIIFKSANRIALPPVIEQRLRNVVSGVVDGVAFHAHHLGFNEGGAFSAAGSFAGFVGGVVDLAGVGAVYDYSGNSVADGALGELFYGELHFSRSGISPQIVFDYEHQA